MKRAVKFSDFNFHDKYSGSIGIQCPPMPGPGVKRMKPYGLVLAASITSQTSIPSLAHINAISLTRPMFTARKVFSSNFTISAVRIDDTGTIRSIAVAYKAEATVVQAVVAPPSTLGVLRTP